MIISIGLAVMVPAVTAGAIGTAPTLGTADSFAVLAGSAVTNTGPSVIDGDLGVSPDEAISGFPPGIVNGTIHADDAVAAQAQGDTTVAYNSLAGQPCNIDLTGVDLGGLTLTAGVYCFSSSAQLTGALTLDSEGDPDAVFIFQIGSTLTTASDSSVLLIGTGTPCNVFWQVGSSATFGTSTDFVGNVLALTSITATTDVTVEGQLLARNGAVTLDTNTITKTVCADETTTTTTDTDETTSTTNGSSGSRRSTSTTSTSVAPAPVTTVPGADSGTGADADSGTGTDADSGTGTETAPTVPANGTPTAGSDTVLGPGGRTGGGGRTGAPGGSTSDGTPTLPTTGMDWDLAIAGAMLFLAGVALLTSSKRRARPADA